MRYLRVVIYVCLAIVAFCIAAAIITAAAA